MPKRTRDYPIVTSALRYVTDAIKQVGLLLDRMHEKCDPGIFYNEIRPFLSGSMNMGKAGLPRGVFYDEGNGKGEWKQLRGGSNGQSSMIQLFDIFLGVDHSSDGNSNPHDKMARVSQDEKASQRPTSFHEEVRDYMPGPHRRFLEHVERMGSIRNLALLPATTPEQLDFQAAFETAAKQLTVFRNKHIALVTRYIVLPAKQAYTGSKENLASVSARVSQSSVAGNDTKQPELTGTGGTSLIPFLRQSRDETVEAGRIR